MKTKTVTTVQIFIVVIISSFFTEGLHATNGIFSGMVNSDTTWTGVDTVKVVGDVYVPSYITLTIDPGIIVDFQGHYSLDVDGRLLAVGTPSERITFTASDHATGWNSLLFTYGNSSSDTSKLVFCIIEYGNANTGDQNNNQGGGLFVKSYYKKLLVSNCIIRHNHSLDDGGGIFIESCSPVFRNNLIIDNYTAGHGGAVGIFVASPVFINNTISGNSCNGTGGGAVIYHSSNPDFIDNILWGNSSATNNGNELFIWQNVTADFTWCDIEGGFDEIYGQGSGTGFLGIYENCIDADPQFEGSGDHPYALAENSPCINQGDPDMGVPDAGTVDMAGTPRIKQFRIDIGAYEVSSPLAFKPEAGNAIMFDGVDDRIEIDSSATLDNPQFTVEFWISMNDPGEWNSIIDKGRDSQSDWYFFTGNPGQTDGVIFGTGTGSSVSELSYSWNDTAWHHVAGTYDGSKMRLYVDGELKGAQNTTMLNTANNLMMGCRRDGSWFFKGKIDEIAVWDQARTVGEIRDDINLTYDGTETGLISYWQFNEGTGVICNEFVSGNMGTLMNTDDNNRIESPIPLGPGASETQIVDYADVYQYYDESVTLLYNQFTGVDTVVITKLETAPNINPSPVYQPFDSQYWVVRLYGNGSYDLDVGFTVQETILPEDEAEPQRIKLYQRGSNADTGWTVTADAAYVIGQPYNNTKFDEITLPGQFIVCRQLTPEAAVAPDSVSEILQSGYDLDQEVILQNTGTGDLNYSVTLEDQIPLSGGPDADGYYWIDSDHPDGPEFEWVDISATGDEIITNGDITGGNLDDGYKTLDLPFIFKYYGENKPAVKVSTNGYLTFDYNGTSSSPYAMPDPHSPNNVIALNWGDLAAVASTHIFYFNDLANRRLIVQYDSIRHYYNDYFYTFQVLLYETGNIEFNFLDITDNSPQYMTGIENDDGTIGLGIADDNMTYIHDSLSVRIGKRWIECEEAPGTVTPGLSTTLSIHLNADAVYEGQYSNNLVISSNDQTDPVIVIPVSLTASLDAHINLDLKAFLEGPFNGTGMNVNLTAVPLTQPYNTSPWNYDGTESVTEIPSGAVDWVLVQLRDAADATLATPSTTIARQAAFLMSDGSIRSLDGTGNQQFNNLTIQQSLFAVVYHRNHLAVMSANPLTESGGVYSFDFTTAIDQAYNSGQKDLGGGHFGMFAGDAGSDGLIDTADKSVWAGQAGKTGYKSGDLDLNGQVDNRDKNDMWFPNVGEGTQVPE